MTAEFRGASSKQRLRGNGRSSIPGGRRTDRLLLHLLQEKDYKAMASTEQRVAKVEMMKQMDGGIFYKQEGSN